MTNNITKMRREKWQISSRRKINKQKIWFRYYTTQVFTEVEYILLVIKIEPFSNNVHLLSTTTKKTVIDRRNEFQASTMHTTTSIYNTNLCETNFWLKISWFVSRHVHLVRSGFMKFSETYFESKNFGEKKLFWLSSLKIHHSLKLPSLSRASYFLALATS